MIDERSETLLKIISTPFNYELKKKITWTKESVYKLRIFLHHKSTGRKVSSVFTSSIQELMLLHYKLVRNHGHTDKSHAEPELRSLAQQKMLPIK